MKKITLIVLAILVCVGAFAKQKHKKKQTKQNKILSVGIHRTGCYGRCPNYIIDISNDGTVIYTGVMFTEDSGAFRKNIGKAKAQEIIAKFETYRVDTCRNIYRSRIPDMPGMVVTVKYKDSTKMIRDANSGPDFLKLLAEDIDNAGKKTDNTWKKVKPAKN